MPMKIDQESWIVDLFDHYKKDPDAVPDGFETKFTCDVAERFENEGTERAHRLLAIPRAAVRAPQLRHHGEELLELFACFQDTVIIPRHPGSGEAVSGRPPPHKYLRG